MVTEMTMGPDPTIAAAHSSRLGKALRTALGGMSIFTMLMTIPQVLTIWISHQASGVSILSWSAYLVSAVLWLYFGMQQQDWNIYLPCLGWMILDTAVILGTVVYGATATASH
jgi:uncharacterized protein with PQ loop repeat